MTEESAKHFQLLDEAIQTYKRSCGSRREDPTKFRHAVSAVSSLVCNSSNRLRLEEKLMAEQVDKEMASFVSEYGKACLENNFDLSTETSVNNINVLLSINSLVWNSTDMSGKFCQTICKDDSCINTFAALINARRHVHLKGDDKNLSTLLYGMVMIVYNIAMHEDSSCVARLVDLNFVELIKPLLHSEEPRIRVVSLLFMAYTTTEKEAFMFREQGAVAFVIESLKLALETPSHRGNGYDVMELARGLEKLSTNDDNKRLLVENNILPLMAQMLHSDNEEYQRMALVILWSLSFDEANKKQINNELGSAIEQVKVKMPVPSRAVTPISGKSEVANENEAASAQEMTKEKALSGLRWTMRDDKKTSSTATEPAAGSKQHVFLSYNHQFQQTVLKIADFLRNNKFNIWIDTENIQSEEDIMEAMATGVENAAAICVCYSKKYKESENCRSEAQYAHSLKKTIIPVLLEPQYKAHGWLGLMIGEKYRYDFTGKYPFDEVSKKLLDNIAGLINKKELLSSDEPPPKPAFLIDQPIVPATSAPLTTENPTQSPTENDVRQWTDDNIKDWLQRHQIEWKCEEKLTGESLHVLKGMKKDAPEFFYQYMDRRMTNVSDMAKFVKALEEL